MRHFRRLLTVVCLIISELPFSLCEQPFSASNCNINYRYSLMEGYSIVAQAYYAANESFFRSKRFYNSLKHEKQVTISKFLDTVIDYNTRRANSVKMAVMQQYKLTPLKGFTKDSLPLEEVVDYVEHCMLEPEETEIQVRSSFLSLIKNFEDNRHFEGVNACEENLPDEILTAQCIVHKTVLLKDALNNDLLVVISAKVKEFVQTINSTFSMLEECLNIFVPKFTTQLPFFDKDKGKEALYSEANELLIIEKEFDEDHFENLYEEDDVGAPQE